jgi:CBS domain-containing protein
MKNSCPFCGFENPLVADHCGQCLHSLMKRDIPSARRKGDAFQDALLNEPVSELLTGLDLLVCSPDDSIEKIVKIFRRKKKGASWCTRTKKWWGSFPTAICFCAWRGPKDLSKVKVEEVMTRDPSYVLHPEDPIAFAINKMAMGGHRHVPVLRPDGTPVSILPHPGRVAIPFRFKEKLLTPAGIKKDIP